MKNPKIQEARAQCALCGDIISSCTEFSEASCGCGAIGVRGGIDPLYRGIAEHIIVIEHHEYGERLRCPHCHKEFTRE